MEGWSGRKIGVVYGDLERGNEETVNVENFNSILRERVGRLVHKSKDFSKMKSRLRLCL
jgi:IS1 family transposase